MKDYGHNKTIQHNKNEEEYVSNRKAYVSKKQ